MRLFLRKSLFSAFAAMAALTLLLGDIGGANAATITWGSPTTISGDSDVDTTGTLVGAFSMGGSGVPTTTVNGVIFTGIDLTGASVTSGNFTFTLATGWHSADLTSSSTPFAALSPSYQSLLAWSAGDSTTPATVTMSGLTVGAQYEFEWWSNISHLAEPFTTATAGNSVTLNTNTTGQNGGIGQFAIGTFTADASSETVTWSSFDQVVINGIQLRELMSPGVGAVPEPGSLTVLAIGAAGLVGYALRRRKKASR